MQKTNYSLLLHPLFLGSLLALLLNDFYWKHEYGNWLTGKLSDLAGLIVLPVFCKVLFPRVPRGFILFSCAVFFIWWKSPLSQAFIEGLNQYLHLPVKRVMDYSDLMALFVLPFATQLKPKLLPSHRIAAHCLRWSLGAITFFSLCATSMPYRSLFLAHPDTNDIYFHETYTQKRTATDILHRLAAKGIAFRVDSVMFYPVLNQRNLYYREQKANDSAFTWRQISQLPDSTLFVKREGHIYYLIQLYKAEQGANEITLRNIRFTLSENKKGTKTAITVETFEAAGFRGYFDNKKRNMYKEVFRKLFF